MKRDIRPLARNPNKHTQRGLRELERSVREDGWVAPVTVAADGESLDGAARLEVAADVMPVDPLVVEHDGTRPVVMVRTDIPNAETPQARRIAYRANRVAELDLDWDADVLTADVAGGLELEGLWEPGELGVLEANASDPGGMRPWDLLRQNSGEWCAVTIGEIETMIRRSVVEQLRTWLDSRQADGEDVKDALGRVIEAGLEACGS